MLRIRRFFIKMLLVLKLFRRVNREQFIFSLLIILLIKELKIVLIMMHIIKNCGCVAVDRDVNWGFDLAPSLCNLEDYAPHLRVKMVLYLAVTSAKKKEKR